MISSNPSSPALPQHDIEQVVAAMGRRWHQFANRRLFITGGTGFFGRWMLETLFAADRHFGLGVRVVLLTRDPAAFAGRAPHLAGQTAIRLVAGSATDLTAEMVQKALGPGEARFDFVVHMATEADLSATLARPLAAIDAIAGSTRRALDFTMAAGAKRLLLTSSGSVYARRFARTPIAEDFAPAPDPLDMGDANAISGGAKRQAEALCAAYAREHGLGATVARCFAFLAPGLPLGGKFAAGNFVRDALALRPVVVRGDGSPIRSYLYGSDLAVWLWTLLLEGVAGQAYNVGSETGLSLRELAHQVVAEVAPGLPVEVLAERNLVQASDYYVPSTARARSELGLVERVSLAEAIRKTAEWQMAALKH